jgi:hypothetical protein
MYPYRCFALVLADDDARLGASAVRYSFTVGLFHSFQLAGFDRRTDISDTTASQYSSRFVQIPAIISSQIAKLPTSELAGVSHS